MVVVVVVVVVIGLFVKVINLYTDKQKVKSR
jgi:hypothetical protein